MSQLIYLSRHGTVKINKSGVALNDPHAYDLLEEGVQECRDLGSYLRTLNIQNPFFVNSGLARTVTSTQLVADSMGIEIIPTRNYHSCAALEEDVPWEGLTNKQKEEYHCGRHRKKPIKFALGLGAEVHQELYQIANDHPEHNLIAILHGGINLGLMTYITGKLKFMDNCGLYVLEKVEDKFRVLEDYISPEQMRKAMEQAKQIRAEMIVR